MRILGIDPGLNTTGYGVIEITPAAIVLREAGVVRGRRDGSLGERVRRIHEGMADIVASLAPGVVALEELYSHYARPRTAILMGHARGVICLAAAQANVPVEHYAATQVKRMLTGNGRATKRQIQLAIQRELSMPKLPEPADVADALALALCHHYSSRTNQLVEEAKVTAPLRDAAPAKKRSGASTRRRTRQEM